MKKGWKQARLDELTEADSPITYGVVKPGDPGEVLFIRGGDLVGGRILDAQLRTITSAVSEQYRRTLLKGGELLICLVGQPGQVAVAPPNLAGANIARQVGLIRLRSSIDAEFISYFLQSPDGQAHLGTYTGGSVQQVINLSDLRTVNVPVPPLTEQQRIVGLLDEAFKGLATAKANAEKNLQNTRALFESHLQSVFTQHGEKGQEQAKSSKQSNHQSPVAADDAEMARLNAGYVTRTGGREATLRHIPGNLSLAVGMPNTGSRQGWRWSALTDLARLESGHTPSRRHPEYWGGSVPWIGIQDARENHGRRISDTFQKTNELGIANSSARVLPENTVCLSRTASVGYVVVMARPMATSQDFVNWVCSDKLQPEFLKYLILAEGREGLLRYASGSVHQTIYFPEAKAFHICYPEPKEQLRIVRQCDEIREETQRLARLYERKYAALEALKKSLLHQAFTGAL
jgi:restriction endonuclease S subunit